VIVHARRDRSLSAQIVEVHPLPGVRAGSALLKIGGRLLVVQDDAWSAVWIDPRTRRRRDLVIKGHGKALPKSSKPDFEAALQHGGAIFLFGSGSRRGRQHIVRWRLRGNQPVILDGQPLYHAVRRALQIDDRPNVEGACVIDARLRLFHRGSGGAHSATIDFDPDVLAGAMPRVLATRWFELGKIDGTALSFTDARACGAGRVLYLVAAENTKDAVSDGPVAGSAIGVIDRKGARWTPLLDPDGAPSHRKFEGLALDRGCRSGWLITDADDPDAPSELCRVRLRGSW